MCIYIGPERCHWGSGQLRYNYNYYFIVTEPLNHEEISERNEQPTHGAREQTGDVASENPGDSTSALKSGNESTSATTGQKNSTDSSGAGSSGQAGEFITVIFHALLTPTFNINFRQGDKVVLRGEPPFSWNKGKQIEMKTVRYIFIVH